MPKISIVTPFLNGLDLIPDYTHATQGAEVIAVDNGSTPDVTAALAPFTVIRNEENRGFAGANNQGYAQATGDIIIFLNSDIAGDPTWLAAVAADVKDGALYGPSLAAQLVYGEVWEYLEGWCIAATKATWERLRIRPDYPAPAGYEGAAITMDWGGPWDALSYPGPYWEDNALCLAARQCGIALVQTAWNIQHKGGRSAGPLAKWGESFEANRATFARALQPIAQAKREMSGLAYTAYQQQRATESDIQHHLDLLFSKARGNVVELGTRSGVSTSAFLAGVELRGGTVISIDTNPACANVAAGHPQWSFIQGSSTDVLTANKITQPIDVLLIDTIHTTEQVTAELSIWASRMAPGGTMFFHDIETFPGVRKAVETFVARTGWQATYVRPCNGMAMVEVPND